LFYGKGALFSDYARYNLDFWRYQQDFVSVCNDNNHSRTIATSIEWKQEGNRHKFILTANGKVKLKQNGFKAEVTSNTDCLWK
jgi:hypothetical protein